MERDVLAGGVRRVSAAWDALANGSKEERRAAAALLGWYRDAESIPHVFHALANAPGAVTRRQLLFDLNMILLTEGRELADPKEREQLAAQHLTILFKDLANNGAIHSDIRPRFSVRRR